MAFLTPTPTFPGFRRTSRFDFSVSIANNGSWGLSSWNGEARTEAPMFELL